jgi:hypothetical protein
MARIFHLHLSGLRAANAAAVVIAIALIFANAPAQAQATEPMPKPPEPGTSEYTDAAHKDLLEAIRKGEEVFKNGTAEQKDQAAKDIRKADKNFGEAVDRQADNTREVREAYEWADHYRRAEQRIKDNPNAGFDEREKATKDLDRAYRKAYKAKRKAHKSIESGYYTPPTEKYLDWDSRRGLARKPDYLKSSPVWKEQEEKDLKKAEQEWKEKWEPEQPKQAEQKDREEPEKEEKQSGDTSGPLDFLGNVKIGIGVGAEHSTGQKRGSCTHGTSQKAKSSGKGSSQDTAPRGCGRGMSGGDDGGGN